MKKLVFFLAAMCCSVNMMAQNNVITYEAAEKLTLDATKFEPNFASHTFADGKGTITFSSNVTKIKASAFANCVKMTSIVIPGSVSYIDTEAFAECTGITSILVPTTVSIIHRNAFRHVNNVEYNGTDLNAPWGAKCKNGTVEGYAVYSDATKTKLCGYSTQGGSQVDLPASVKTIGQSALYQYDDLRQINLPSTLTTMEDSALFGCMYLQSITLPSSLSSMGDGALGYCAGLKKIICLRNTAPTCGTNCFQYVKKNIPVYVPDGKKSSYTSKDGWSDFTNIIENKSYSVWVKGMRLSASISDDVLGDSTVTFDAATHTLTLNQAYLLYDEEAVIKTEQDLVIHCIDSSTIYFNGDEGNGLLSTSGHVSFTGDKLKILSWSWNAILTFGGITISDGCSLTAESYDNAAISMGNDTLTIDGAALVAKGNNKTATISGCNHLVMNHGVAIRSGHTFDSRYGQFLNAQSQEAKDDIIINTNGAGIEEINQNENQNHNVRKVMHNGQLVIIRDGKTHNALGARLL